MGLDLGSATDMKRLGDITTLNAIPLTTPSRIEANLGFQSGRLAAGFKLLVLLRVPEVDEFEFAGNTMRSGGKLGLPQADREAEARRPRVHDEIMRERGPKGYQSLQKKRREQESVWGPRRLIKIKPETEHDRKKTPDEQYPMGGGFLQ